PLLVHDLEGRLLDRAGNFRTLERELRGQPEQRLLPRGVDMPAFGDLQVEGDLDDVAGSGLAPFRADGRDVDCGLLGRALPGSWKLLRVKGLEPRGQQQGQDGYGAHHDYYRKQSRHILYFWPAHFRETTMPKQAIFETSKGTITIDLFDK